MSNPKYALQDVPGKGKGLVATKDIPKGTLILEEKPIMTGPKRLSPGFSLRSKFNALSQQQQQAFLSLHNVHPYRNRDEQYLGIFKTNGLPIIDDEGGLFIEICRINHACNSNACHQWNILLQRQTVYALRDIQKGEEITISYLGSSPWTRKARGLLLKEKFDFECSCCLCRLPPDQAAENDKVLTEIFQFKELSARVFERFPLQAIRYLDQTAQLLKGKESLSANYLGSTFVDVAKINLGRGDLARARVLSEKAIPYLVTLFGNDSVQVIDSRGLATDPSMSDFYGITSRDWATSVDNVPSGLGSDEFENWLWRREEAHGSQLYTERSASFLHSDIFPAIEHLPQHKDLLSPAFYENSGTPTCLPRRHWCFLGEILGVDEETITPPYGISVRSIHGTTEVHLDFNNDAQGNALTRAQLKQGYTIAVLYAQRIGTVSKPGITIKNAATFQVWWPSGFL